MRDPARWIVVAILAVAFGLRLAFVLGLPERALYWDEPHYAHGAEVYRQAWLGLAGGSGGPGFLAAFRGSLQKGEAYSAAVGLLYALVGVQPRAVYALQALLDTVTCLLLFGLARAVSGSHAGVIALVLAAFYEPFIFSAARLQTETLTLLLCVAGLWALCVPERRRAAGSITGGALIAAAVLARPALQWLFPLLLPAVLLRNWDRAWRDRVAWTLLFAAGFFVIIGPRLVVTTVVTGEAIWSGTLDPSVDMYGGAVLDNVGWKTDHVAFAHPPHDELLAVLGNDPTRRPEPTDFRAATMRTWVGHPAASAAVLLHKLYEAWLHPYNDSRWTFLSGERGPAILHRIVLILALIGMPLSLQRWRVAVPLIVATLYLWLTYLVVKIEVRYAVTAMPMMICFAAVAIACLSSGWQRAWRAGRRRRLVVLAAGTAAGLVAATTLSIARLLELPVLTPETAHALRVGVLLAAMVWIATAAAVLVHPVWQRATALALLAPSLAIAACIVLFGRPLAQPWREWRCTLGANDSVASQEFVLPSALGRPLAAALELDLLPSGAVGRDVVVRLNGEELTRYRGGVKRGDADLPPEDYFQQIFLARRRTLPEKAWYTIPVPVERLEPGNRVEVQIAHEGNEGSDAPLTIFGDYPGDAATYDGPSLFSPRSPSDTSLYKYLAEDDFRMRRSFHLAGPSHSRFYDGSAWSDQDLAPDPGRQSGRYRIFLMLTYDRGIVFL